MISVHCSNTEEDGYYQSSTVCTKRACNAGECWKPTNTREAVNFLQRLINVLPAAREQQHKDRPTQRIY